MRSNSPFNLKFPTWCSIQSSDEKDETVCTGKMRFNIHPSVSHKRNQLHTIINPLIPFTNIKLLIHPSDAINLELICKKRRRCLRWSWWSGCEVKNANNRVRKVVINLDTCRYLIDWTMDLNLMFIVALLKQWQSKKNK